MDDGGRVKTGPDRIGPLSDAEVDALGLTNTQNQLSEQAGRPVNFMLFDSTDGAMSRPSLWAF